MFPTTCFCRTFALLIALVLLPHSQSFIVRSQTRLSPQRIRQHHNKHSLRSPSTTRLHEREEKKDTQEIFSRFTSPIIDDPGLPLSDGLVAQVIGPSLQLALRGVLWPQLPLPSWATMMNTSSSLLFDNRPGTLLVPTLIHGAALALVWLLGALAAEAYRQENLSTPSAVAVALFRSAAFAAGLWMLATQLDVWWDGDTDSRRLLAFSESVLDLLGEAVALVGWRTVYVATVTKS